MVTLRTGRYGRCNRGNCAANRSRRASGCSSWRCRSMRHSRACRPLPQWQHRWSRRHTQCLAGAPRSRTWTSPPGHRNRPRRKSCGVAGLAEKSKNLVHGARPLERWLAVPQEVDFLEAPTDALTALADLDHHLGRARNKRGRPRQASQMSLAEVIMHPKGCWKRGTRTRTLGAGKLGIRYVGLSPLTPSIPA
jgi:hypothetical protein